MYDESTLNDELVEDVDASSRLRLRNYFAANSQVDLSDIAFQVESLLFTQKRSGHNPTSN